MFAGKDSCDSHFWPCDTSRPSLTLFPLERGGFERSHHPLLLTYPHSRSTNDESQSVSGVLLSCCNISKVCLKANSWIFFEAVQQQRFPKRKHAMIWRPKRVECEWPGLNQCLSIVWIMCASRHLGGPMCGCLHGPVCWPIYGTVKHPLYGSL